MKRKELDLALYNALNKVRLLEVFFEMDGVIVEVPLGETNFATEGVLGTLHSIASELDHVSDSLREERQAKAARK